MFGIPLWMWIVGTVAYYRKGNGNGNGGRGEGAKDDPGAPEAGKATTRPDGYVHKFDDGSFVFACNKLWWVGGLGKICCKAASGTTVTVGDGSQVVCGYDDGTESYRWRAVPSVQSQSAAGPGLSTGPQQEGMTE